MPTHKFGLWTGPRLVAPTELHPGDRVFLDETDVWICRMAGGKKLPIPVNVYWNGGEGTELRPRNKLVGARARDRFPEIAGEIALAHNLMIVPITIKPPPAAMHARPHQVGFQFAPIA